MGDEQAGVPAERPAFARRRSIASEVVLFPILTTLRMFWRPLVLIFFNTIATMILVSAFYNVPMPKAHEAPLEGVWGELITRWLKCVLVNQDDWHRCEFVWRSYFDVKLWIGFWYYAGCCFVLILAVLMVRWDLVLRNLRGCCRSASVRLGRLRLLRRGRAHKVDQEEKTGDELQVVVDDGESATTVEVETAAILLPPTVISFPGPESAIAFQNRKLPDLPVDLVKPKASSSSAGSLTPASGPSSVTAAEDRSPPQPPTPAT